MNARWFRVNKKIRCGICHRPDWCTYCPELSLILCMRVESDRLSNNSMGGWLHKTDDVPVYVPPKPVRERPVNMLGTWSGWRYLTDPIQLDGFAMAIGVDVKALRSLGCAWNGKAWAFPMRDGDGKVIGIRLRNDEGQKWAVKGSHQGLFIPDCEPDKTAWICEGPTDTAAALTLGLFAIGRPSCMGQEEMIAGCLKTNGVRRVVIVADNDEPGQRGARKLKESLKILSCIWSPPAKDLREFVRRGGSKQLIEAGLRNLVWTFGKEKGQVVSLPHGFKSPSIRTGIIA